MVEGVERRTESANNLGEVKAVTFMDRDVDEFYLNDISNPELVKDRLASEKKFYDRAGVLPAMRNMHLILAAVSASPLIEIAVASSVRNSPFESAAIFRVDPQLVIGAKQHKSVEEEDGNSRFDWVQPSVWKSKGVKVERVGKDLFVSYVTPRGERDSLTWKRLRGDESFASYSDRKSKEGVEVTIADELARALSRSDHYFDGRSGVNKSELAGPTESRGATLKIR